MNIDHLGNTDCKERKKERRERDMLKLAFSVFMSNNIYTLCLLHSLHGSAFTSGIIVFKV